MCEFSHYGVPFVLSHPAQRPDLPDFDDIQIHRQLQMNSEPRRESFLKGLPRDQAKIARKRQGFSRHHRQGSKCVRPVRQTSAVDASGSPFRKLIVVLHLRIVARETENHEPSWLK